MQPFNPITGDALTGSESLEVLSGALSFFKVESNKFGDIIDTIQGWLKPHYIAAAENGDNKFLDYWQLRLGARRFDKDLFKSKAPKELQDEHKQLKARLAEIEEEYKKRSDPIIALPKF